MILFNKLIPASHLHKIAQIIPEQSIAETLNIYEDALPYIRCQIQSTIQHEAAHRADEEQRNQQILQTKQTIPFPQTDLAHSAQQIMPFQQFVSPTRAEPIAEREEENCETLLPEELTGRIISIDLNQLFNEAKTASKIDPRYKSDIKAGHLPPSAQGMFIMQDQSGQTINELVKLKSSSGNVHTDEYNNLWIDVRKIIAPFVVSQELAEEVKPPTYQGIGDGAVQADLPGVSQIPPQGSANSTIPIAPAIQGRETK